MDQKVEVEASAEIYPTENEEKVKKCIENVLDVKNLKILDSNSRKRIIATATGTLSLLKIYKYIRRQRIQDAARRALKERMDENTLIFYLNKQAAYAKKISFCSSDDEFPLGAIRIKVLCKDPKRLLDWLAPTSTYTKKLWIE